MLRYERTPHVSAPKLFALGKNTQLVLYHTFRKARWMYWYKKSLKGKKKKTMLRVEPPGHVLDHKQYDTYARAVLIQLARRVFCAF